MTLLPRKFFTPNESAPCIGDAITRLAVKGATLTWCPLSAQWLLRKDGVNLDNVSRLTPDRVGRWEQRLEIIRETI